MISEGGSFLEEAAKLVGYMGHTVLDINLNIGYEYVKVQTPDERQYFFTKNHGRPGEVGLTRLMSVSGNSHTFIPTVIDGFQFTGDQVLTDSCLHELQIAPFDNGFTLWAYCRLNKLTESCIKETLDIIFSGGFNIQ